MLSKNGLYSAIADPLDEELMAFMKGELPKITDLIYRSMEGEEVDLSPLPQKEAAYVKTARVLMAQSLYSDAWLEI
jgi:5-methyltetrahydrofolate corrinoid/iron sulfur protein methyltransferase